MSFAVVTVATPKPDLVISIDKIDHSSITYGATPWTWVTYTVKNQGTALATGPINSRIISNGVIKSGYMTADSLSAGQSVTKTFAVGQDTSWPVGSYVIKLETDYQKTITELDENNNYSGEMSFAVVTVATPTPTPTPLPLRVSLPNGGETWTVGSIHTLTWTGGSTSWPINVFLVNSTKAQSTTLATSVANNGSFAWTIPSSVVPASYYIRVACQGCPSGTSGWIDDSDTLFTVSAK